MNLASSVVPESGRQREAPSNGLGRSLERLRLQIYLGQMVADIIVVVGSFMLAGVLYEVDPWRRSLILPAQLLLPIFLTIALYNGTYSLPSLRNWRSGLVRVLMALVISGALLNFIAFFAQLNRAFSRGGFIIAMVLAALLFVATRRLFAIVTRRLCGPSPVNVLVIDDGGDPIDLPDTYRVRATEHGLQPALDDPHSLDRLSRYVINMDQVVVSCPPEKRVAWAMALKGAGVHSEVTSSFMNEIGALGVVRREEAGLTTLLVATGPLGIRARVLKRGFDVAVSFGALVITAPVFLIAALAIKLDDGGPVLFRQRRIGRRNQLFSIYKLRTMSVDGSDADGNRSTQKGDARITRIGNFLRRTSIDELPQLINVLKGDMSLVGPRPLVLDEDRNIGGHHRRQRLQLTPGITGPWQVLGTAERRVPLREMVTLDYLYAGNWSLWTDVKILLRTAVHVVRGHGL